MALENGEKPVEKPTFKDWRLVMLRIVSFLATAAATLLMALNKETKTLVVASPGGVPVKATLTAKFEHDQAFV